jgi:hypothetical protein
MTRRRVRQPLQGSLWQPEQRKQAHPLPHARETVREKLGTTDQTSIRRCRARTSPRFPNASRATPFGAVLDRLC